MASGAKWACFTTWNGGFITANGQFSDEHTEADIIIKNYQSEYVLTLDELPDWDNLIDEPIEGDVNADETFNVADVVMLQKWLLAIQNVTLVDCKAADMCEDNRIAVFDLCLLKRKLLKHI